MIGVAVHREAKYYVEEAQRCLDTLDVIFSEEKHPEA